MSLNKSQSGRSMIEMLGVLAIVGILSAGGIAGYSMAMQNHKTNAFVEKVHLMAQQTRALYNGVYNITNADALINAGLITDNNNPFGGVIRLDSNGGTNGFIIQTDLANIPPEACVKIIRTNFGGPGVVSGVSVVDVKFFAYDRSGGAYAYPISLNDAVNACKSSKHAIRFFFK